MATWISWEKHRRTKELCQYLGIQDTTIASNQSRWLRHPSAIIKTIWHIVTKRPKTLIVQCPSIFLGLIACALKPIMGYKLIVDAHSDAIESDKPALQKFFFLYKLIHKIADVSVVTNQQNADVVKGLGGRPFVLPDRLFDPPILNTKALGSKYNIAFVCSFDVDEPYAEVFEAFKTLEDTTLYVTGRAPQTVLDRYTHYQNIIFTGYTPLEDYMTLLNSVDGILALTTRENCTLCAANEAVSFRQPMIISNSQFLRDYFSKGAIYADNTAPSLREAFYKLIKNHQKLKDELTLFKPHLEQAWEKQGKVFKEIVYGIPEKTQRHPVTNIS
jgi:glycosyltransferase involved in cell wall biosynthesis